MLTANGAISTTAVDPDPDATKTTKTPAKTPRMRFTATTVGAGVRLLRGLKGVSVKLSASATQKVKIHRMKMKLSKKLQTDMVKIHRMATKFYGKLDTGTWKTFPLLLEVIGLIFAQVLKLMHFRFL